MAQTTTNRHRTIAAMALLRDGDEGRLLADYCSDADREACLPLFEAYEQERDVASQMRQLVRQMVASERFSSLAEVHPAWILERLREEPPRIIGLILRLLPSKHVRYLVKHLPPMLAAQIPNMIESFAVPAPILEILRRRFEQHFLPMRITRSVERLGFDHLYYLKGDELAELVRELGITELAFALQGVRGKALHAVFNRLKLVDAKRLQRRIREVEGFSHDLFRQARATFLELESKHVGPERMLMQVGLSALADAMGEGSEILLRLIQQKLEPSEGYLLKRLVEARRPRRRPSIAALRQDLVLHLVAALAQEQRIDAAWSRFGAEASSAPPISLPSEEAVDDETATVEQLA